MDRLILLRHGKAEADASSGKDFDRALTDRGRRDAVLVARALADAGLAAQTWDVAAAMFPRARVEAFLQLYEISSGEILALARGEGAKVGTVMVVGHNPGLGHLAAWLAQDAPGAASRALLAEGFPTAAAAVIGFSPPAFDLYTPKTLGGGR
jgi:phosphohistidine phosphatase